MALLPWAGSTFSLTLPIATLRSSVAVGPPVAGDDAALGSSARPG